MAKKKRKVNNTKNSQKKATSKKHEKQVTKLYFGIGGFLIIILAGLILFNMGIFEQEREIFKFTVDDECSIIMGNLIHNVRDEGDCKIKCMNNCEIRELDFYDSEFILENSSCHTCDCFCR